MPRLIDAWELEARVRNFHGRGKKTMLEFIRSAETIKCPYESRCDIKCYDEEDDKEDTYYELRMPR